MDYLSLADRFRAAAIVLDEGTDGEREALFEALRTCALELTASGQPGLDELASLMDDESPWVAMWAATHLAALGNAPAVEALERLSKSPTLAGFAAKVALDEHRAGRLRSPFDATA
jgi:HEAT repeat protein